MASSCTPKSAHGKEGLGHTHNEADHQGSAQLPELGFEPEPVFCGPSCLLLLPLTVS